jgi:hypothetical protein
MFQPSNRKEGRGQEPGGRCLVRKEAASKEEATQAVRELALGADPRITESIKWSTPTFEYKGNTFSFNPAKKFVSLLFHTGAHLPGTHKGLEGDGDTARVMRFRDLAEVQRRGPELTAVLRTWCEWKDRDR